MKRITLTFTIVLQDTTFEILGKGREIAKEIESELNLALQRLVFLKWFAKENLRPVKGHVKIDFSECFDDS